MTLPIYVYGSEVLREVAEEVDVDKTDKEELRRYIDDMFETMYHADGVGLAAPQGWVTAGGYWWWTAGMWLTCIRNSRTSGERWSIPLS